MHTANRAKFLSPRESLTMRTVRNITVAVEPELYRQTRRIAADYDTTVTDMVRFLLIALPEAVKAARYPGGRPQFGLAAARAARAAASAPPAATSPNPSSPSPENHYFKGFASHSVDRAFQPLYTSKPPGWARRNLIKSIPEEAHSGYALYDTISSFGHGGGAVSSAGRAGDCLSGPLERGHIELA